MPDPIQLMHGDCLTLLHGLPDDCIDLTVTSPPYDNMRTYNGNIAQWSHEKFMGIAKELYRVTRPGGCIVWIVADATVKGSETGSSFRQALYFHDIGFNLHDTMICIMAAAVLGAAAISRPFSEGDPHRAHLHHERQRGAD